MASLSINPYGFLVPPSRSGMASVTFIPREIQIAATTRGKRYMGTTMREARLAEMIKWKMAEMMEACDGDERRGSDECRVAWDEVEEVSQAKAHFRQKIANASAGDPLEPFCRDNPETNECHVYYLD